MTPPLVRGNVWPKTLKIVNYLMLLIYHAEVLLARDTPRTDFFLPSLYQRYVPVR